MEKSRSFPEYSSAHSGGEFGFEDRCNTTSSYSFNGQPKDSDPELKRKKRIAAYNVFTTEGKVKSTVRSSFKWIKTKFTEIRGV
ncbi:hypothetical protein ACHQM5_016639 [Ranunculus cassubicifolius]